MKRYIKLRVQYLPGLKLTTLYLVRGEKRHQPRAWTPYLMDRFNHKTRWKGFSGAKGYVASLAMQEAKRKGLSVCQVEEYQTVH